jgi:hypothetical protein
LGAVAPAFLKVVRCAFALVHAPGPGGPNAVVAGPGLRAAVAAAL